MLNSEQLEPPTPGSVSQPVSQPGHVPQLPPSVLTTEPQLRPARPYSEPATIGKGLIIRGEITGADSLVIEGTAEGNIHLEGNRVTVGRDGNAAANITAREVIVMGKVRGNITATDRVDIRAEGSVIGDLSAPRLSIEDGAFFKGGIDIRKPGPRQVVSLGSGTPSSRTTQS